MHVGTVAAGRIGLAVLQRLKPFDVKLHYSDRHRLPAAIEKELGLTFHPTAGEMVPFCDVVTINTPLHTETENLFDDAMIGRMKPGTYLVNTARGKIWNRDAVVRALKATLAGYAGDVWFPQPAPQGHPCQTMPHHGMTPQPPARHSRPRRATLRACAKSSNAGSRGGRSARSISSSNTQARTAKVSSTLPRTPA
jgi:formate dehydrogenase